MHRSDSAELTGTVEQLRRKFGILPEELTRCLQELKTNEVANVRFGNGDVSIVSRRRQKELKVKENNRLYVAKHREKDECKTDVRIQSKSKSKSIEIREEIKEEKMGAKAPAPLFEIFLGTVESALSKRLGISSLPNRREWHQKLAWAFENKFTAEAVIECYDLLKLDEFWQTKFISAKTLTDNLANLESLRRGAKQHKRTEKLPTTAEKLADAATNNAALIQPPRIIEGIQ